MRIVCSVILIASTFLANASIVGNVQKEAPAKTSSIARTPTTRHLAAAKVSKARLGSEYKKIASFVEFRKKLLADGWRPVSNLDCREVVLGADYQDRCGKSPGDVECRVCQMVPELFRSTSDGYSVMHYVKDGTPLSVTVYGDMRELDEPGKYAGGFVVSGWEYTTSINANRLG